MKTAEQKKLDVSKLTGKEAVETFLQAKAAISAHTLIKDAVKAHYETQVIASGDKQVLYIGEDGAAHGFERVKTSPKISMDKLEAVLAEYKLTPAQIADVKKRSKGEPGHTFGAF